MCDSKGLIKTNFKRKDPLEKLAGLYIIKF